MSLIDYIFKPDFIRKNEYMQKAFSTSLLYVVSKVIGAVVGCMVILGFGPEVITSVDTGATIIDLCGTLFCIVISFSFILPFLTDCGIMESFGVLLKPVVRPLFRVPWTCFCRLDGILVWCIQCSSYIDQRTVYEGLLYEKRSRLYHDKLLLFLFLSVS